MRAVPFSCQISDSPLDRPEPSRFVYLPTVTDQWCSSLTPNVSQGVGHYPQTDGDLKLSNGWHGWVAGDAQVLDSLAHSLQLRYLTLRWYVKGTFRGIVAAMVSGAYAAHKLRQELVTAEDPEVDKGRESGERSPVS